MNSNESLPVNKTTGEIQEVQIVKNAPVGSIRTVTGLFNNPAVKALVGKGMSSVMSLEHLSKMAVVAVTKMPKLLDCTQESFLFALTTAGQLGLDPSGSLGRAYIIPYGKIAQFQIGYRGYIDLVCRARMAKAITVHIVWKDEMESMQWDKESMMRHTPNIEKSRDYTIKGKDDIGFFYMVANHGDGIFTFAYMTGDEVDKVRSRFSKQPNGKAWSDSYTEMGKKTMIIRGSKLLPMSTERVAIEAVHSFQQAISTDDDNIDDADYEEITLSPGDIPITNKSKPVDKPADPEAKPQRTISEWIDGVRAGLYTYDDFSNVRDSYSKDEVDEFENRYAALAH